MAKSQARPKKKRKYLPKKKVDDWSLIEPIKTNHSVKVVKTSLKSIIRDQKSIDIIDGTCKTVNKIVAETLQFIQLYFLHLIDNCSQAPPTLDLKLVDQIMKTVSRPKVVQKSRSIKAADQMTELKEFYDNHFLKLKVDDFDLSYYNIGQILKEEAKQIITGYSNHISREFEKAVNRYVNVVVNKPFLMDEAKTDANDLSEKQKTINQTIRSELRVIKNDILYDQNKSDSKYDFVKKQFKENVLNGLTFSDNLMKVAQRTPLKVHILMIRMSRICKDLLMERRTDEEVKSNKLVTTITAFIHRKTFVPRYIAIDTESLILLLMDGDTAFYRNNNKELAHLVWNSYFMTMRAVFRAKGYRFGHRISTDGVGCSIQLERNDYQKSKKGGEWTNHKAIEAAKKAIAKKAKQGVKNPTQPVSTTANSKNVEKKVGLKQDIYVDQLTSEQKRLFLSLDLVGIDPGTFDLIFATNGNVELVKKASGKVHRKTDTFTYTYGRRWLESGKMTRDKDLDDEKKSVKVDEKTIQEYEDRLSKHSSSSCSYADYQSYLKVRHFVASKISKFYERRKMRQNRWKGEINRRRSEDTMVNRFKEKFGSPDKVGILYGDFSQRQTLKGRPPTLGKGMRRVFERNGYRVLLVDEFRTSCRLYKTGEELVNFQRDTGKRKSYRIGRDRKAKGKGSHYVHRLLSQKTIQEQLKGVDGESKTAKIAQMIKRGKMPVIINRDLNGSLNILHKGRCVLKGEKLPEYFNRPKGSERKSWTTKSELANYNAKLKEVKSDYDPKSEPKIAINDSSDCASDDVVDDDTSYDVESNYEINDTIGNESVADCDDGSDEEIVVIRTRKIRAK